MTKAPLHDDLMAETFATQLAALPETEEVECDG
jgi:hypothetical protein